MWIYFLTNKGERLLQQEEITTLQKTRDAVTEELATLTSKMESLEEDSRLLADLQTRYKVGWVYQIYINISPPILSTLLSVDPLSGTWNPLRYNFVTQFVYRTQRVLFNFDIRDTWYFPRNSNNVITPCFKCTVRKLSRLRN